MSKFSRISRLAYLIEMLLMVLLIIPAIHAQDTSDKILYAVENDSGENTIYSVNVDDGLKTQIGIIHTFGSNAGWSPDGKFIYLLDYTESSKPTLTLVDSETHQRQIISDPLEENHCSLPLWWSPDGHWLAYATQSDSRIILKIFNTSTGDIQTLDDPALPSSEVSWSPDGRYFAYRMESLPVSDKVAIRNMENQQTLVLGVASSYEFLHWSPTEHLIAFNTTDSLYATIYNLTDDAKKEYGEGRIGNWSPDGHFLTIYRQDKNGRNSISVIDVHSNKTVEFDREMDQEDVDINTDWSPDGRYLAVMTRNVNDPSKRSVYILDVIKKSIQLTQINPRDYDPFIWSHIGNYLAVVTDIDFFDGNGSFASLWLLDVDSYQSRHIDVKIPYMSYEKRLNWSAIGRYMLLQTNSGFALVDWKSGKLSALSSSVQIFTSSSWSPDGVKIAAVSNRDIFVIVPEENSLKNVTNTPDEYETFLGWRGSNTSTTLSFCGEG